MLSAKQIDYINNAHSRWNVKTGATRSGKTYLDYYYTVPQNIIVRKNLPGLVVLLGNTRGTLQRNLLDPMAELYGSKRVGRIRADNTAILFGERVYCLGADNKKHVDRIRGAGIKYCYGDEVTTWDKDVFEMLKSRLDKPYSRFDGTCNPDNPRHWFKLFLDGDADIYQQAYTINDNPFLPPGFVEAIKREYYGTVYYDRYILGLWTAAEGVIYRPFADKPELFIRDEAPNCVSYTIGVDFGANGSAHAFSCVGFSRGMRYLGVADEYYRKEIISPAQLERDFIDFVRDCHSKGFFVTDAYCDSAETTLIQGLRTACARERLPINIIAARKVEVNDRIRCLCRLMASGRFWIAKRCTHTIDALRTAVWDAKKLTEDVRLDDGNYNIDSLDAMEYAYERYISDLMAVM